MKHTDLCEIYKDYDKYIDTEITVCGWIRNNRDSKNMCFIALNDGTVLQPLQIAVEKAALEGSEVLAKQGVGASIKVTGKLIKSFNDKQPVELQPTSFEVLGECPSDDPLQKKKHSMEFLRTIPYLRGRTNTFNAMFRVRSQLAKAIHEFFQSNNFTYVHTPIITGSDCEGAGEVFRVTTHDYNTPYTTEEE